MEIMLDELEMCTGDESKGVIASLFAEFTKGNVGLVQKLQLVWGHGGYLINSKFIWSTNTKSSS